MQAVLDEVEQLVATFRQRPECELEVRVGLYQPETQTFQVGESADFFRRQVQKWHGADPKANGEVWSSFTNATRALTLYFENGVRGRYLPEQPAIFERIQRIRTVECRSPTRPYHLRFSLKQEAKCEFTDKNPPITPATFARSILFWNFVDKEKRYRCDFRKVQSGKGNKEEALKHPPHYEAEIELQREYFTLLHPKLKRPFTNREIALHFVNLGIDLLGRCNKGVREPVTLQLIQT